VKVKVRVNGKKLNTHTLSQVTFLPGGELARWGWVEVTLEIQKSDCPPSWSFWSRYWICSSEVDVEKRINMASSKVRL